MKDLAAIYARRSDKTETEESVNRQVQDGISAIQARSLTPVIFREPQGIRSGYYENRRPEWQRLKRELETNPRYAALWVADLARASRNRITTLQFVDWLQQRGIEFISQKEQIDPHTAMGRAFIGMIAVMNQFYRDDVSERKLRQYAARDKSIYASNVQPFGLQRTGHYPNIVWTPTDDFPVIVLIAEMYVSGHGAPAIARALNARSVKWINRKLKRVPVKIHTIDSCIQAFERYQPFLDAALYHQVVTERTARTSPTKRPRGQVFPPFLLTGILFCSECGGRFHSVTQEYKRSYGNYLYRRYQHRNAACALGTTMFPREAIDNQVWQHLAFLNDLTDAQKKEIAQRAADPTPSAALDTRLKREKLLERLRGYEEMRADKEITRERFAEVKQQIEQELQTLPEILPSADAGVTFELAYEIVNRLGDMLRHAHNETPAQANQFLRSLIQRILFDGQEITRIEWVAPFNILERTP